MPLAFSYRQERQTAIAQAVATKNNGRMDYQQENERLKRRLEREISSRKQAETIMLQKAMELRQANEELRSLNEGLEQIVSERTKALEDSEQRYRQLIENATDIIYRADAQGLFTYANQTAFERLGYSPDEIIGHHFTEFVRPDWQEQVQAFYVKMRDEKQKSSYLQFPILTKSGETIWLAQNVQAVFHGDEIVEVAAVARDSTKRKRAEDSLKATQLLLTSLIGNLQSGVLVENEKRRIVLTNQLFCEIFDIKAPPEALEGADCSNSAEQSKHLFKNPNEFEARIDEILQKREIVLNEEIQMADGRILLRDFIPISAEGKHLGHLWQYRDLTEEKRAEEKLRRSEEKYRGIIENMELGLMEVDNMGRIHRAYQRFCEMTGYEESALLGQKANDILLPPEFAQVMKQQAMDRMKGKAGVYEIQLFKKDGSRIWVMISGAPIFDQWGKVIGTIGIHYDVTPQKKLQQELFEARLRAEEAQEAEKQFLANMSHEIRTPLNAIIGMTHLLFDTSPSAEQSDYLDVLKHSADILQSLINDILDISKIREGKMEPHLRPFDLSGLVTAMSQIFQRKLDGKPIEISLDVDPELNTLVVGDDLMLKQVLLNLLGNAEKFTLEGQIGIKVSSVHRHNKRLTLRFDVSDTGIGIPQDKMDVIFQSFRQVDGDIKRRFGGTGLGLSIVKRLIELQNGTIWVSSTEGVGTTFSFELSYEDTGEPALQNAVRSQIPKLETDKDLSVLVVEDNAMNRKYVSNLFNKWGVRYEMAFNGKIGYEMAQAKAYDLILMDIQMPEMDGYETTIAIRNSNNPNRETPIIALTASAMLSKKDRAFQLGMNDYISKPFNPLQLYNALLKFSDLQIDTGTSTTPSDGQQAASSNGYSLDHAALQDLYGDDDEYAMEMFEMFFSKMEEEYPQLRKLLQTQSWKPLSKLAHKIKPAFPMVGLTWVEPTINQLELASAAEPVDQKQLEAMMEQIEGQVAIGIPLVKAAFERLREGAMNDK